jgi:putative hemolysin
MREALAKLLLIAAILLLPFGMGAPAAAAQHHTPTASSAMSHCPEEGTSDQRHSGGECTMACASTLPAVDQPGGQRLAPVAAPSARVLAAPLTSLYPETATPPPRLA